MGSAAGDRRGDLVGSVAVAAALDALRLNPRLIGAESSLPRARAGDADVPLSGPEMSVDDAYAAHDRAVRGRSAAALGCRARGPEDAGLDVAPMCLVPTTSPQRKRDFFGVIGAGMARTSLGAVLMPGGGGGRWAWWKVRQANKIPFAPV